MKSFWKICVILVSILVGVVGHHHNQNSNLANILAAGLIVQMLLTTDIINITMDIIMGIIIMATIIMNLGTIQVLHTFNTRNPEYPPMHLPCSPIHGATTLK
ncbi:hypothetical protein CDAR_226321 [Caerostris darwini]|uniref:Uncharacterized protein n=1 Tax=Caerostris darwini TaxID=1538125 RepID=A0AAV4ULD1_9ARAC|nr:hypothetical protein CDAR_226321 [Caerostris darwini]